MSSIKPIRERKHRLSPECYRGKIQAAFTLCFNRTNSVFQNKNAFDILLEYFKQAMEKHKVLNWVYVLMPNHLHFILEGISEDSDVRKTVILFKQLTGFWLGKNHPEIKWQKDFYDHILREGELPKHIRYILRNPVRQGLVTDWKSYPYKGSLHKKLDEIL